MYQFQVFIYIASTGSSKHAIDLPVHLKQGVREVQTEALLDSGAYSCYINPRLVDQLNLATISLEKEIRVYNADASHNKGGTIKKGFFLV